MPVKFVRQVPFRERTRQTFAIDGTLVNVEEQLWQVAVDQSEWNQWSTTGALLARDPSTGLFVPPVGALHALLPNILRCREVECTRDEQAGWLFNARVIFGPRPEQNAPKWYIKLRVSGVERSEDLHNDRVTGKPVCNSAGDPFDPPLRTIYYDEQIEVQFNSVNVDWDLCTACRGRTNSAQVTMTVNGQSRTFPPNTLKLVKADYETTIGDGLLYYAVSVVLHVRFQTDPNGQEIGHALQVVDRGMHRRNRSWDPTQPALNPPLLGIRGADKMDILTPVFLDGKGQPLVPDQNFVMPKCVLLPFNDAESTDLNPLLQDIR